MAGIRPIYLLVGLCVLPACFSSSASPDRRLVSDGSPCRCANVVQVVDPYGETLPTDGGAIRIRILREPTSLLSLVDSDPIVGGMINHSVLETLVRVGDTPDAVVPELADAFEVDGTSTRYTFHLAEAAKWHDGRPVTSADVRFVFGKIADPSNPFPPVAAFTAIADIDTPDEDTVVFTLDRRVPDFLEVVATVPILPMHVFGRTPLSLHEASRAPIGSGPYRFVRWVPSQLIELERNPEWRGPRPHIDEVRFLIVPDNRIARDMFAHGDLDVIWDFPIGAAPPTDDGRVISYPLPFLETILYNSRETIFSEPEVRRAISLLIDRKTIRCAVLDCRAELPSDPASALQKGNAVFQSQGFDRAAAEVLLDGAGWMKQGPRRLRTKGGQALSFSLLIPNLGGEAERVAVIVQEDMAAAGIELKISVVSRGAFIGRLNAGRFDAAAVPLELGGQDSVLSQLHSESGSLVNSGGARDAVLDGLIEHLQAEVSSDIRQRLRIEAAKRAADFQPVSFLYRSYGSALVRSDTGGVRIRGGHLDLSEVFRVRGRR